MDQKALCGRRHRYKRHLAWEREDRAVNGAYTAALDKILRQVPNLTPTQARIAALVRAMLPSHEIARILAISEHAVEKQRSNIRRRAGIKEGSLHHYLTTLCE